MLTSSVGLFLRRAVLLHAGVVLALAQLARRGYDAARGVHLLLEARVAHACCVAVGDFLTEELIARDFVPVDLYSTSVIVHPFYVSPEIRGTKSGGVLSVLEVGRKLDILCIEASPGYLRGQR